MLIMMDTTRITNIAALNLIVSIILATLKYSKEERLK